MVNMAALPDYKGYMRDGGIWIHENIAMDVPLITNDRIIDYYAQRPDGEKPDSIEKIEKALNASHALYFVALKVDDEEKSQFMGLMNKPPIVEFRSNRASESLASRYNRQLV
jgi:hypothetical protein